MDPLSTVALYFVLWWLCLFIALPIGVRSADETGEQVKIGNEPGAPTMPNLGKKMLIATVLAAVLLLLMRWALASEWLQAYWA